MTWCKTFLITKSQSYTRLLILFIFKQLPSIIWCRRHDDRHCAILMIGSRSRLVATKAKVAQNISAGSHAIFILILDNKENFIPHFFHHQIIIIIFVRLKLQDISRSNRAQIVPAGHEGHGRGFHERNFGATAVLQGFGTSLYNHASPTARSSSFRGSPPLLTCHEEHPS